MSTDKKTIPDWVQKVIGWGLITLLALGTTTELSKWRIDALTEQLKKHEQVQSQEMITHPQFDQFQNDLYKRLDRMENKIDRQNEREFERNQKRQ